MSSLRPQKLLPKVKDFKAYFAEFYGEEGIYPKAAFTDRDLEIAMLNYAFSHNLIHGDSIDREAIRDFLFYKESEVSPCVTW